MLLSMLASGIHTSHTDGLSKPIGWISAVTEQQMIMKELTLGSADAEADIQGLSGMLFLVDCGLYFDLVNAEFRPPTMYYTTIPLVSERQQNRRWDASKLRELRKRLDSGTMTVEEVDQVAADFLDGEIVDLASDWLGNTVRAFGAGLQYTPTHVCRLFKSYSRSAPPPPDLPCWNALHHIWQ